jgi:DNA repair exonuclease SbcCD nuclease subunit
MRFVHLADTHLGYRQYGRIERQRDWSNATRQVIEYAIGNSVDFVIHSGDLFNSNKIDQESLLDVIEMLSQLKRASIPFFVIDGNHDGRKGPQRYSTNDILKRIGLCRYLRPDDLDLSDAIEKIGDYNIIGLGYHGMYLRERLQTFLEQIPDGKNIVLLHAGVEGYIEGEKPEVSVPELDKFKEKTIYLALGHQHDAFRVNNWIFNPGSIENGKFESKPKAKIFYDVTIDDDGLIIKEIQVKTRKMYYLLIECNDDWNAVKGEVREKIRCCDVDNSLLRIKIHGLLNDEFKRWEIEEIVRERGEPLLPDFVFDETHPTEYVSEWESMKTNEIEEEILNAHFERFEDKAIDVTQFVLQLLSQIIEAKPRCSDDVVPIAQAISAWRRDNL